MLRSVTAFHFSPSATKAARIALSAATIAGLTVLGACSDSPTARTITAPPSPLNSTTFGADGVFANAGTVKVCVDGGSPSATYQFTNSNINSNDEQVGAKHYWDFANGGSGQDATTNSNPYTVTKGTGGCVTVLSRTRPDDGFLGGTNCPTGAESGCDGHGDTWSGITVTATVPSTDVYSKTDCFGDAGVKPPVADPCSAGSPVNNNNPTRAYMNAEHGTVLTFFFGTAERSTGLIAPTATTCQDYANGTASTESPLMSGIKGGKINNTAPGVFFYYAHINIPSGPSQSVGFGQSVTSTISTMPKLAVQQGQAYVYNSSCSTVGTLTLNTDGTLGTGGPSLPTGNYILGIKFSTGAPKGTSVPSTFTSGSLLATFNYWGTLSGSSVATTTASVNMLEN